MEVGPPTLAVLSVTNRRVVASGVRRATTEARAGISHNRLAVILRGDRPMTVDELVRICEAIGVSAAAVLREAEEMLSTAPPTLPADDAQHARKALADTILDELRAHRITKAGACRIAGISRPTLDALIAS